MGFAPSLLYLKPLELHLHNQKSLMFVHQLLFLLTPHLQLFSTDYPKSCAQRKLDKFQDLVARLQQEMALPSEEYSDPPIAVHGQHEL